MRASFCAAAIGLCLIAFESGAADPASSMKQCAVGPVKMNWKVWKANRCQVFDSAEKLKEGLEKMGWSTELPRIDWSKEAAVVDAGEAPYGNAVATCDGVFLNEQTKKTQFRWKWQEQKVASSASASTPRANTASGEPLGDQVKDSIKQIPKDAVDKMKAVGEDFKKFPSPIPGRVALVASFPKELLAKTPKLECRTQK
jgi:hypothetical protein